MNARKVCIGFLSLFLLAFLCIAQQKEIKKVPMAQTDPTSGKQMFAAYCSSCHGVHGKGNVSATTALKTPPPDLTTLAKRNNGKYPTLRVASVIRGDTASPSHVEKDMPVWGTAFRSLHPGGASSADAKVQMRISSLNDYIESLQEK